MATPAAYIAFTAPINPNGVEPILSKEQVWAGLERKVRNASEFVGGAIKSTEVISEAKDEHGRPVITRDVIFEEGNRKVQEICTFYEPVKIEFAQPEGSRVLNVVSDSGDGQLYMTFQFEWLMPKDTPVETQQANVKKWNAIAKKAVESSIGAIRAMVKDGRIKI